jgi:hypothetical protein
VRKQQIIQRRVQIRSYLGKLAQIISLEFLMRGRFGFAAGFNFLTRLLGVFFVIAGMFFLLSAYAVAEHRVLDIVVGIWGVTIGAAFIFVRGVRAEQFARIRRLMGWEK